jgi:hypothetical protein
VGYRESAGPRRSRYRRGSKHPRCLSSPSPPAMSRIARNPARLGKRAEHMIELVSSARRLGREIAPVVGVDRANAGAPARRHRCRRERVRQALLGLVIRRTRAIHHSRSGLRLWPCLPPPASSDGHTRSTDRTTITMAEWMCREADRIDPAGLP